MGKLVVTEFMTLDGVMQDPGGAEKETFDRGGWAFRFERGEEGDRFKLDELAATDAQLLGRVTYDGFAKAWPTIEAGDFGVKMNAMPKFVVSSTLTDPTWNNTTVLNGDLAEEVGPLKERFAGDILVAGSATLVQSLLALGLVDQLNLMVYPVLLGEGKRLFADAADMSAFDLVETRQAGATAILILRKGDDDGHDHSVPLVRQRSRGGGDAVHVALPELEDPRRGPLRRRRARGRGNGDDRALRAGRAAVRRLERRAGAPLHRGRLVRRRLRDAGGGRPVLGRAHRRRRGERVRLAARPVRPVVADRPPRLPELLTDPDPGKAQRVMAAMLQMRKIDVAALEAAAEG